VGDEHKAEGIEAGADDFLSKPFLLGELRIRLRSFLRMKAFTDELESAETVLMTLARSIEAKDPYTEGHCERLAAYGVALGAGLGAGEEMLTALRGSRGDPAEGGRPHGDGAGDPEAPSAAWRGDLSAPEESEQRPSHHPQSPREMGWIRVSGWSPGHRHPLGGEDSPGGGCIRCAGHGPAVSEGAPTSGGHRGSGGGNAARMVGSDRRWRLHSDGSESASGASLNLRDAWGNDFMRGGQS
jgi:CheY-like chemotaxis protein